MAVRPLRAAVTQQERRERDRSEPDRDVDEEDPRPAEIRRDDAAKQDARGRAAARGGAVDPERTVALVTLGERRHQERERSRREQRASQPLQRAEAHERARRPREAAEQRARREEGETRDEHAPAAEQVGEPAAEQQRAAEENGVRGDHPLDPRFREAEVRLDRREGDVDDCHVEDDHELSGDDESECAPAPPR